jgi:hypothetical protein
MLSPEKDNRAVSESEVKVTPSTTETGEPIRKQLQQYSSSSRLKMGRAQRPRFV